MSFDSETSVAIPDPLEDSPLEPPSWTEDYFEDYGILSSLSDLVPVPAEASVPDEPSILDLLSVWQSDGATIDAEFYTTESVVASTESTRAITESALAAINSTLAVNGTSVGTWMTTVGANVTELVVGQLEEKNHELTMTEKEERILVPEGVIVFLLMLFFIVFGLLRTKCKNDALIKQTRDAVAMNTDDLAFYHKVDRMQKKTDEPDACDTKLPNKMPAVGGHDMMTNKYTSLVPILADFNIIPGRIEIVRVQMKLRPSFLPHYIRSCQSLPDTLHENRPIETLGRCPRTTSSSPAIMNGLWQHYREELVQKGGTSDACPIHGTELHQTVSNTSASDGRVTPPAYRGESEGFEMRLQSSGSTIPRKITCRFCRERSVRNSPWTTPGASPLLKRKAVTPPMTRSPSHVSVLQSGIAAIAEAVGTVPSHALCYLGPIKIDHMDDIKIFDTADKQPPLSTHADASSNGQITKTTEELFSGRRMSCKPEIKLDVFKSLLASSSSHGSKSGGSLQTTSVSSSNFAARLKEDGLYLKSSTDIEKQSSTDMDKQKQRSSSADLHVGSSTTSKNSHRFSIGKSKSDNLGLTASKFDAIKGSLGHLEKSSSDGRYGSFTNAHSPEANPVIDGDGVQSESSGHLSEDETSSQDSDRNGLPSANTICKVHSICQSIVSQVASATSDDPVLAGEHRRTSNGSIVKETPTNSTDNVSLQKSTSLNLDSSLQSVPGPSIKRSSVLKPSGSRHTPVAKSSSVRFADSVLSHADLVKTNSSNAVEYVDLTSRENGIRLENKSSSNLDENDPSQESNTSLTRSRSTKSIESTPSAVCCRSSKGIVAESASPKLAISDHSCSSSPCCCSMTSKSPKKGNDANGTGIETSATYHPIEAVRSGHDDTSLSSKPSSKNSVDISSSSTLTSVTPIDIDDSMHSIGKIESYIVSSETSTNKSQSGEQTSNSSEIALYSSHALNKGGSGKLVKSFSSKLFSSSESDQLIWKKKSNRSVTEIKSPQDIGALLSKRFMESQSHEGNQKLVASSSRKLKLSDQVLAEISPQSSSIHAVSSKIRRNLSMEYSNIPGDVPQAPDGLRSPPELQMADADLSDRPEVDGEDDIPQHALLSSYYGEDSSSESSSTEDELTWLQKF